ncbi:MAG: DUF4286 family protein [Muribaculaceae bacterium]|nr:DUF4286 family protein [Muribaculaceae bacterium]
MYIHNTTFIVDREVVIQFVEWARSIFVKAACESGRFHSVTIARILTQVDPDTVNFAIQMTSESLESATEWHNDVATLLKDALAARLGAQRVMFFTTDMEVIS